MQAATEGRADAGVTLPNLPVPCSVDVPHAPLVEGAELAIVLRQERNQLDRANQISDECARFYNNLKSELAGT